MWSTSNISSAMSIITGRILLVFVTAQCLACKVPVHMAQSSHNLVYSQEYPLCSRERLVEDVFQIRFGAVSYANVVEKAFAHGSIHFHVMPVPGDLSSFTIEGRGRHRLFGQLRSGDAFVYL